MIQGGGGAGRGAGSVVIGGTGLGSRRRGFRGGVEKKWRGCWKDGARRVG